MAFLVSSCLALAKTVSQRLCQALQFTLLLLEKIKMQHEWPDPVFLRQHTLRNWNKTALDVLREGTAMSKAIALRLYAPSAYSAIGDAVLCQS